MNTKSPRLFLQRLAARRAARLLAATLLFSLADQTVQAANYYWDPLLTNIDPGSGGTNTWDTTSTFWKPQGASGDVVWPNTLTDTADFAGTAGTVTLGSAINAQGVFFDTAGYTLATSTFALTLGTSGIVSSASSGTTTVSGTGAVIVSAAQTWSSAAGGALAVSAPVTLSANLTLGANTTLTGVTTLQASSAVDLGGSSQTLSNLVFGTSGIAQTYAFTNGSLTVTGASGFSLTTASGNTTRIVDLSGLSAFTFNQSAQSFTVGPLSSTAAQGAVTFNFSNGTNNVTASSISIGRGGNSGGNIPRTTETLGVINNFNTANLNVGAFSESGTLQFNAGLASAGTLTVRGTGGGLTPATAINLGAGGFKSNDILDTTAGTLDAIATTVVVGSRSSNTGSTENNALSMSAGTLNTGTIQLGNQTAGTSGSTSTLNSTLTQNAGVVLAGTVTFGQSAATSTSTFTSTYNLGPATGTAMSGVLSARTLQIGAGNRSTTSRATVNFYNGTITNYDPTVGQPGSAGAAGTGSSTTVQNLTISGLTGGGTAVDSKTLNIVLQGAGTHNFTATTASTITVNSTALISGTGALTANGGPADVANGFPAGTLILNSTNTYTGNTTVASGILQLTTTGSINTSPQVSVFSSGTLTLQNSAALSDSGLLSLVSGATLDLSAAGGTETIGALMLNGTMEPAKTYSLADLMALDGTINFTSANGETLTVGAVPEPSALAVGILGLGVLSWSLRRRSAQDATQVG